jgi:uncharacterized membrane protein YccC
MSGAVDPSRFSAYGPSLKALGFAVCTTMAAALALLVAQALGIHHSWWAAMTVWLVAQPTRGLLIERSVARLGGTVLGAAVGAALLLLCFAHPVRLVVLLAGWVALCAAVGSCFRHFRNYGWVLAGYTASIVALFGVMEASPDLRLALSRVACTIIGIFCSSLVSLTLTAPAHRVALRERLDELVKQGVLHCLEWLARHDPKRIDGAMPSMLAEIAALDPLIDQAVAGSLRGRRRAQQAKNTLRCLIDLFLLAKACQLPLTVAQRELLKRKIDEFRHRPPATVALLKQSLAVLEMARAAPDMRRRLSELEQSLARPPARSVTLLARIAALDGGGAALAAARPVLAMVIAGLVWAATQWSYGPLMMMTATLFATLFSSHEQGNAALRDVLIGSLIGAAGGLLSRMWLLPSATGNVGLLLAIVPFLAIGAFLMAQPRTSKLAIDVNMTFLLTSQPALPILANLGITVEQASATLAGVLVAVATYHFALPASREVRRRMLARRITQWIRQTDAIGDCSRRWSEPRSAALSVLLLRLIVLEGGSTAFVEETMQRFRGDLRSR